jgi:hypothetical protein
VERASLIFSRRTTETIAINIVRGSAINDASLKGIRATIMEKKESLPSSWMNDDNTTSCVRHSFHTNMQFNRRAVNDLNAKATNIGQHFHPRSSKEVDNILDKNLASKDYRRHGVDENIGSTPERLTCLEHNPSYVNNTFAVRNENDWFYYGLVRVCRQERIIRTSNNTSKTVIPNWYKIRDYIAGGTTSQFAPRTLVSRDTSVSATDDINVVETTVLALLCRLDMHPLLTSRHHNFCYDREYKSIILDTIRLAIHKCPLQLFCGEAHKGYTPLRIAVCNPRIIPDVIELLLWSSIQYAKNQAFEPYYFSLTNETDKFGLTPMDHIVQKIQMDDTDEDGDSALECLSVLITYSQPSSLRTLKNTPNWSTSSETQEKQLYFSNSLIRLLSLGRSFKRFPSLQVANTSRVRKCEDANAHKESRCNSLSFSEKFALPDDFPTRRFARIMRAVQMLIDWDPTLLYQTSDASDGTPLHECIIHYGNYFPLVDAIIQRDQEISKSNSVPPLVHRRNRFGDLPLHLACTVGAPIDVLQLLIQKTAAQSGYLDFSLEDLSTSIHTSCFVPHPILWSSNNRGHTLIDLEWIRFYEFGALPLNRSSRFYTGTNYPLNCRSIMQKRRTSVKTGKENRYDRLLEDLLCEVVNRLTTNEDTTTTVFVGQENKQDLSESTERSNCELDDDEGNLINVVMDRILLMVRIAFPSFVMRNEKGNFTATANQDCILHLASALLSPYNGPTLPTPILTFLLWKHPEQLLQPDPYEGKLPLHIALSSHSMHPYFKFRTSLSSLHAKYYSIVDYYKAKVEWKDWVQKLVHKAPVTCGVIDKNGRLPLHCALDSWGNQDTSTMDETQAGKEYETMNDTQYLLDDIVQDLITNYPQSLETADPITELFPFQAAAANSLVSLNMVYTLLRQWPSGVSS